MIDDLFAKFDGAFAPNTLRAYRSDFKLYLDWCENNSKNALPPEAETLADYVEEMLKTMKSATIRRRINCLTLSFASLACLIRPRILT